VACGRIVVRRANAAAATSTTMARDGGFDERHQAPWAVVATTGKRGFDGRLRGVWARFAGAAFAVDAAILFGEVARLPAGEPRSARRSRAKQRGVRLHDLEVNLGW
jgi:hypothetical protein